MTGQEQQLDQSAFNQRSDAAASVLKGELSQRLGIELPETKVQAGPDGKPPPDLPPEGSYERARIEQQQALAASNAPITPVVEQEVVQPIPEQQPQEEASTRAQARIADLIASLREKDQQIQQMQSAQSQTEAELRHKVDALTAQYEQIVQSQLDTLDPETRGEVIQNAAIKQAVAESESKIMQAIAPTLQRVEERELQRELSQLAYDYPGFKFEVHYPLMKAFRESNPACTFEHAFKAIATVEELAPAVSAPAPAVPPSMPPGRGSVGRVHQQAAEQANSDPEQEMREEAQAAYALRRSVNPEDQKAGLQMIHRNMEQRLSSLLPGQ